MAVATSASPAAPPMPSQRSAAPRSTLDSFDATRPVAPPPASSGTPPSGTRTGASPPAGPRDTTLDKTDTAASRPSMACARSTATAAITTKNRTATSAPTLPPQLVNFCRADPVNFWQASGPTRRRPHPRPDRAGHVAPGPRERPPRSSRGRRTSRYSQPGRPSRPALQPVAIRRCRLGSPVGKPPIGRARRLTPPPATVIVRHARLSPVTANNTTTTNPAIVRFMCTSPAGVDNSWRPLGRRKTGYGCRMRDASHFYRFQPTSPSLLGRSRGAGRSPARLRASPALWTSPGNSPARRRVRSVRGRGQGRPSRAPAGFPPSGPGRTPGQRLRRSTCCRTSASNSSIRSRSAAGSPRSARPSAANPRSRYSAAAG